MKNSFFRKNGKSTIFRTIARLQRLKEKTTCRPHHKVTTSEDEHSGGATLPRQPYSCGERSAGGTPTLPFGRVVPDSGSGKILPFWVRTQRPKEYLMHGLHHKIFTVGDDKCLNKLEVKTSLRTRCSSARGIAVVQSYLT